MLTAPVTTPTRRGWMRYFLAALALCSPVNVLAATVTPTGDKSITVNTGTIEVGQDVTEIWANSYGDFKVSGGYINTGEGNNEETNMQNDGRVSAYMLFGYAYDANYTGGNEDNYETSTLTGDVSIVKKGGATLVMATENSFTGGVKVENGALYLGHAKAAGTGVITLNNSDACNWDLWLNNAVEGDVDGEGKLTSVKNQQFTKRARQGAELMVNCPGSPDITNSIVLSNLSETGNAGQAHISFGYATYGDLGDAGQLPCAAPGRVTLSGGVFGSGELVLHGYSYSDKSEFNYVSTFTINESALITSSTRPGDAFSGTVVLKNAFNETPPPDRAYHFNRLLGGAVQLNLQDNVFANATIDLTRDSSSKEVGWKGYNYGVSACPSDRKDDSQTSDNILVLDGSVALKSLTADFLGSMWWHQDVPADNKEGFLGFPDNNRDIPGWAHDGYFATWYIEKCDQAMERWRVRVVSSGADNTLTLDDSSVDEKGNPVEHVFDGAMGFEQSYVKEGQTYINEFGAEVKPGFSIVSNDNGSTPPEFDASFAAGGGTLGSAGVNLVKKGTATQYIHTAMVKDLTLKGGTLGFNHLTLNGNLTMTGGTTLKLGVVDNDTTEWENITDTDYDTTNTPLQFKEGQILSVAPSLTLNDQGQNVAGSVTSTIEGSITIESGATLDFNYLGSDPTKYGKVTTTEGVESYTTPLLSITGNLTLAEGSNVTVSFPGLEYFLTADEYYLAEVTGKDSSISLGITNTSITLGHGYTGIVEQDGKYLILTIKGQQTRTWTGAAGENIWKNTGTITNVDSHWKEKQSFDNAEKLTVLFGNTIPAPDTEKPNVVKPDTPPANGYELSDEAAAPVKVDGVAITVQQVQISGEVTPGAVIINPSYYVGDENGSPSGSPVIDATNYYFTGINNGAIGGDASVLKQGEGTAIFNLANTYSGGTTIEGGRLVMQNQGALGKGGIVIQNGATLQGDFTEMEITNTITVKHNAGNTQAQDAVLRGRKDTKLTIADLDGAADTTLLLQGKASEAGKYGVFEVVDASGFSGTVKLAGYLHGKSGDEAKGGNVQLQITSSATNDTWKNDTWKNDTWTNATIDLSTNAANRTVLALNATGDNATGDNATVQLSALQGTGTNSSVVNMSGKAITLEFLGTQVGVYQGALGYGDYQKPDGTPGHDKGNADDCAFNVTKYGNSSQTVRSAWVNTLTIADGGGSFIVTDDLVVKNLQVAHDTHLVVGNPVDTTYGLNVGMGGILAIEGSGTLTGSDAFAGVGAGQAAYVYRVQNPDNTGFQEIYVEPSNFIQFSDGATITAAGDWYTKSPEDSVTVQGATGNQEFKYTRDIKIADGANVTFNTHHYCADASLYGTATYLGSHVMHLLGNMSGHNVHLTFNNELISGAANQAGVVVKPTETNPGYSNNGKDNTNHPVATEMGFVAIKDIHQFTGESDITVKDKTVLQVTENYTTAASFTDNKMSVTVDGANAAIQFTSQNASGKVKADGISQYVDNVTLKNGGHLLVGGDLKYNNKNGDTAHTELDYTGVLLDITNRPVNNMTKGSDASSEATITNVNIKATFDGEKIKTTEIGGTDTTPAEIKNSHVSTHNANSSLTVHDAKLTNSIVQLHEECSLYLEDAVFIDRNSAILGTKAASKNYTTGPQPFTKEFGGAVEEGNVLLATQEEAGTTAPLETAYVSSTTHVELTTTGTGTIYNAGDVQIMHFVTTSFQDINVTGTGLSIYLAEDIFDMAYSMGMEYIAIQIAGDGQFQLESTEGALNGDFVMYANNGYEITDAWVGSSEVNHGAGIVASGHLIWLKVPEPATATLSLLALAGLCARRRRK